MPFSRLFRSVLLTRNPPGFEQLPVWVRFILNMSSFFYFCMSAEGLRFLVCCTVWLLTGYLFVWELDVHGGLKRLPELTLCLWAIPWLRGARRRVLHRLLAGRWPAN